MENQDKLYEDYKGAARKAEDKGFDRMEAVWNRVEEKLDRKKERRVATSWKYSGVAALLLLFITVGTFLYRENTPGSVPQGIPQNNVTVIDTQKVKETFNPALENSAKEEVVVVKPLLEDEGQDHQATSAYDGVAGYDTLANGKIRYRTVPTPKALPYAFFPAEGKERAKAKYNTTTSDFSEKVATPVTNSSGYFDFTGTITDSQGMPIPGVNVVVEGTANGVQTDFDGKYTLKIKEGEKVVASYVGMESSSILGYKANNNKTIHLDDNSVSLSEVVVEAYRTTSKAQSNVAVTTVTSRAIEAKPNASYIQSLQGQVQGLNISTGSGQPGASSAVILRGYGSINGNAEPLYIIDGVPANADNFRKVNPDDVVDVAVLKDAGATSVYGNRGANGVIIVTTKKGKPLTKAQQRKLERARKELEKQQKENIPFRQIIPQPQAVNQEDYESFVENPFENPATAPLSTFSIDVDNASYTNIRRFINNGQAVPKDAVRVEEMINFFKYQYPQPKGNEPFSINTEYSDAPWNPKHKLLKIGLQGMDIPTNDLPASNFVFLIDVSGSMNQENKLPLLKQSMKLLVKQMRSDDRIAIVVYAGAAGLVLPSTSGAEKDKIIAALDQLSAGGSTAGGAGIELAYKTAQEHFIKKGNNRVILATDGDFNVGASSNTDMQTLIEEKRKSGVFLTCLGYGMGNYKDSKMEVLANKGNGNYAYIDNMQEATRFLEKEFKGSMFAIAKDVKIQIEFNPKHVQSYRLIGYENRKLRDEDFVNDAIDAGELGSGHTVTALYEIIPTGVSSEYFNATPELKYSKPAGTAANYSDELATIKFRHKKPDADKSTEMVKVIPNKAVTLQQASGDFKFAAAVAWFGLKLRDSKLVPNKTSADIKQLAKQGLANDPEGYRAEFIRLVDMVQ